MLVDLDGTVIDYGGDADQFWHQIPSPLEGRGLG
jgi:hypothetical protein